MYGQVPRSSDRFSVSLSTRPVTSDDHLLLRVFSEAFKAIVLMR